MKKWFVVLLILLVASTMTFVGCQRQASEPEMASAEPVTITLWTKEGEADGTLQWVNKLAADYAAMTEGVEAIEVLNKEVETLREDFQTASLAGTAPDLLWTVSDHAGPFTTADLIQPVDGFVSTDDYVESVVMNGKTWAVPISAGNHLMLIYNKDLVSAPPADTDEFIALAQELTTADQYGFVWNLGEAFWLAPWLGGFGGKVFAADGVTPTLNTPEMIATLQFMSDLRDKYQVTPKEADYNGADTLFKEGKAAMIINGDWSLGGYAEIMGDKMGVAPIPQVVSTGKYPAPYTAGVYFMIPKDLDESKVEAVKGFIDYVTGSEVQSEMINEFKRLPGLKAALNDPAIANDEVLKNSAAQMAYGTPMPTVLEMRAVWDAINPELSAVMAGTQDPSVAAANMQQAAEAGIAAQK